MCDDDIHQGMVEDTRVSRRTFGLISVAAAGVAGSAMAQPNVTEKDVEVKTPDGTCDAVLFHPEGKGTWPAVLFWTDIMGLRPAYREMGRRMAAQGYVVLIPNPFYRSKHAPVVDGPVNLNDPAQRAALFAYRNAMSDDGIDKDAAAYLAFLDAQPQTNKAKKAGVQGYCMGGVLAFRTAAVGSNRIAAVACCHPGNTLVTKEADSPHLLIPRTNATYMIAQAQNDDMSQPAAKDLLKAAFAAANRPATVEVYPANHGWSVKGAAVYDEAAAEHAWSEITKLYKAQLV